jgi:hypothetical protein
MLDDWEERELAGIERELDSDRALVRLLAAPTRRERRWHTIRRRFYPSGFLACSIAYMLAAMGGAQRRTLVGVVLVAAVAWVVVEVRAVGGQEFLRTGLDGIGRWLRG